MSNINIIFNHNGIPTGIQKMVRKNGRNVVAVTAQLYETTYPGKYMTERNDNDFPTYVLEKRHENVFGSKDLYPKKKTTFTLWNGDKKVQFNPVVGKNK